MEMLQVTKEFHVNDFICAAEEIIAYTCVSNGQIVRFKPIGKKEVETHSTCSGPDLRLPQAARSWKRKLV